MNDCGATAKTMDVDNNGKCKKTKDRMMLLNEHRRGLVYTVIAQYGTNDDPRFVIKVDVDGKTFQGVGPSRKRAKMMAAEQALVHLSVISAFDVEKPELETCYHKDDFAADFFNSSSLFYQFAEPDPNLQKHSSNIPSLISLNVYHDEEEYDAYANFIGRNSVSILSELRQDVCYRLAYQSKNVQKPIFVMMCKLDGQTFRGEAPSKKLAKARAARDALQELFGIEFNHVEDGMPIYEGTGNMWQNYKAKLEHESFKLIGTFVEKNPVAQLHEIFTDVVYDFGNHEVEVGGLFQCKLKANGEEFDGIGLSKKDAKANAATNALESLRVSGFLDKHMQEKESKKKAKVEKLKESEKSEIGTGKAKIKLHKLFKFSVNPAKNALSKLNELFPMSEYNVVGEIPMRNSVLTAFAVSVKVNDRTYIGIGKNKKLAKMDAAEKALHAIGMWTDDDEYMKLYALRGDRHLEDACQEPPVEAWGSGSSARPVGGMGPNIPSQMPSLLDRGVVGMRMRPNVIPSFRGRGRPGFGNMGCSGRGAARGSFVDMHTDRPIYQNEFQEEYTNCEWGGGDYDVGLEGGYENEEGGESSGLHDSMICKLSTFIARCVETNPNMGPMDIWNMLHVDDSWQTSDNDWQESDWPTYKAKQWESRTMYEHADRRRDAGSFGGGRRSVVSLMSEARVGVEPLMLKQRTTNEPFMGKSSAAVQPLMGRSGAPFKPLMQGICATRVPFSGGASSRMHIPRQPTWELAPHPHTSHRGFSGGIGITGFPHSTGAGRGRGASSLFADEEFNSEYGFGTCKSSGKGFVNRGGVQPRYRGALGFSMGRGHDW